MNTLTFDKLPLKQIDSAPLGLRYIMVAGYGKVHVTRRPDKCMTTYTKPFCPDTTYIVWSSNPKCVHTDDKGAKFNSMSKNPGMTIEELTEDTEKVWRLDIKKFNVTVYLDYHAKKNLEFIYTNDTVILKFKYVNPKHNGFFDRQ